MTWPYCDRCQNTGEVECYCGGDLCVCGGDTGYGTNDCPSCYGESIDFDDDDFDDYERND